MIIKEALKRHINLRDGLDMNKLEDAELKEIAEAITPEEIIKAMFDREVFWFKVSDPIIFYMLNEEADKLLKEFAEADYRHTEGCMLIWNGGIRYENCTEFRKSVRLTTLVQKMLDKYLLVEPELPTPTSIPTTPPKLDEEDD